MKEIDLQTIINTLYSEADKSKTKFTRNRVDNLIEILGVENKEVIMTRYLGYLLNPCESHDMKDYFLREFLSKDTAIGNDVNFNQTTVSLEYHTLEKRRMDIFLNNPKFIRIVEVKFSASDQDNQIQDYVLDSRNRNPGVGVKAIYLTLDNHEPGIGKGSLKEVDDFYCLSFSSDILSMLDKAINYINEYPCKFSNCRLSVNLEQYKEAIEKITNQNEVKMTQLIEKVVMDNKNNLDICYSVFNYFTENDPVRFFEDKLIEKLASECGKDEELNLTRCKNDESSQYILFDINSRVEDYEFEDKKWHLYFCISKSEAKDPCCVGFVCKPLSDPYSNDICSYECREYFRKELEEKCCNGDSWNWISWKYIPNGGTDPEANAKFFSVKERNIEADNVMFPEETSIDNQTTYVNKSKDVIKKMVKSINTIH